MRSLLLKVFADILLFLDRLHLVATGGVFIEPYAKIVHSLVPSHSHCTQSTNSSPSHWNPVILAHNRACKCNSTLQVVYANEGETLGQWPFFDYFQLGNASAEDERIHRKNINFYLGDLISNGFISMDSSEQWKGPIKSYKWFVNWMVRRGAEGLANGEIDFMSNQTVGLSPYPNIGDFTEAILATELNRAAKWEMGPPDWKNVLIQIKGTNTDWCSVDKLILSNVTLSNIEAVRVFPAITGMICFFKGFTVVDSMAMV